MKNAAFKTQCPHCLAEYELNVSLKGRKALCQKCRRSFFLNETDAAIDELMRPNVAPSDASAFAVSTSADAFDQSDSKAEEKAEKSDPFQQFGDEESRDFSDVASDDSNFALLSEFANENFPDPPKGVWRAGEKLLDGVYRVLPLAPGKLYAEGGVGVVQRVRHREWNVDLVVKSPKPGVLVSEAGKESFERECQTWVELGLHENIVACYFVRRIDGVPRLFAELAPDGTLRDWITDGRLYRGTPQETLARILDFSIQFAWGLEHAHRQGLLHLDVKPSNVMTSGTTVKVTDFGLSKIATTNGAGGASTELCDGMTPSYCSPEQYEAFQIYRKTRANVESVPSVPLSPVPTIQMTRQSDVWSWAISVLAMFHGRSPCKMGGQTAAEVFEIFLSTPRPGTRPTIPVALVELLKECFRKNPAERPDSMQTIADRIVEIYRDEIGETYPRRQPKNAALTAESFSNRAISLLDLGKTQDALKLLRQGHAVAPFAPQIAFNDALALWRLGKIHDLQAVERLVELTKNRPNDATAFYALGLLHFERCNLNAAIDSFRRAVELAPDRDDVRQAIARAQALLPLDSQYLERRVLRKPENQKTPVLSVDERGDFLLVDFDAEKLGVLKAKNGKLQSTFVKTLDDSTTFPRVLAVSNDYRWKLFATAPNAATLAPASESIERLGSEKREIRFQTVDWGNLRPLEIAPVASKQQRSNGNAAKDDPQSEARLLFAPQSGDLAVFDAANRAELVRLPGFGQTLTAFAVSPDGRWAATGSGDSEIRLWNLECGRCVRTFRGLVGSVEALWFDPRRRFVVSVSKGTTFQYWRVDLLCNHPKKLRAPHLLCFVNSSEELGERQEKLDEALQIAREAAAKNDVAKIVESYKKARKIAGWESERNKFDELLERRAWRADLDEAVQTLRFDAHEGTLSALAASWNGSFVVSAGKDGAIRLWGRPAANLSNGANTPSNALVPSNLTNPNSQNDQNDSFASNNPNSANTLIAQNDAVLPTRVSFNSANTWTQLLELDGHVDWIRSIDISPNNRFLVSGSWDQNVFIWDIATGRRLRALSERIKNIANVAFAPDGRTVATTTELGVVALWDAGTGAPLFRQNVGEGAARAFKFSRDGRFFATACDDKFVRCWNGRSALPVREIDDFPAPIVSLDWSCDRSLLAAGCANGKIYLVDLTDATGKNRRVLSGHLGGVDSVQLFADAAWLVSSGKDRTVRIWNLNTNKESKILEGSDGSAIALDFAGTTLFVGEKSGILKRWNLRWKYDFPAPSLSREKIERIISTLAGYYAIGSAVAARKTSPSAYYGKNGIEVTKRFSNKFPLDEKNLQNVCIEATYRGLINVPRETIREIALNFWKTSASVLEF